MLLDKTYDFFSLPSLPDFSPHHQEENTLNNNKNNKTRFETLIPPSNTSFSLPLLFVPGESGNKDAISEGLRFMRMSRKGNWGDGIDRNVEEELIDEKSVLRLNQDEEKRERLDLEDDMSQKPVSNRSYLLRLSDCEMIY